MHDQRQLGVIVQRQLAVTHHVNISLDELTETPLLGTLAAPYLLNLIALKGEGQLPRIFKHVAGKGHGQVKVQPQLFTRVLIFTRGGLQTRQQVNLLGGLPFTR